MKLYNGIYRAKVLATDADESDNIGRIKVEVYPMLIGTETAQTLGGIDGIDTAQLPWAVPAMSLFSGAGSGYGSFVVPEVDSFVWVFFEEGDVYQPVYFAEAVTKTYGVPSERTVNYPYTRVFKTKSGIVITINDSNGNEEVKVLHPTGTYLQISSDGVINVNGDIDVDGLVTADDFVSNAGTTYNTHIHTGDSGGVTGEPR